MSLSAMPTDNQIVDQGGRLTFVWQSFLNSMQYWLSPVGQSGTTAQRPVDSSRRPLYIGQSYFDTTLAKPIWVRFRNPTLWVDSTGTTV